MNSMTSFLIGVVCSGLGFGAFGWFGWFAGLICGLAIVTVEYSLSELHEVKEC